MNAVFAIDKEFESLIPPQTAEETEMLTKSILTYGITDHLTVWNGLLLDGHNRHKIAEEHGLTYEVREIELADRTAAKIWILEHQLQRRNLSPDRLSDMRGRLYKLYGVSNGGDRKSESKISTLIETDRRPVTAREMAKVHGVDRATIFNDVKFTEALDVLEEAGAMDRSTAFEKRIPKGELVRLAAEVEKDPRLAEELAQARNLDDEVRKFSNQKEAQAKKTALSEFQTQFFPRAEVVMEGFGGSCQEKVLVNRPTPQQLDAIFDSPTLEHAIIVVDGPTNSPSVQGILAASDSICIDSGRSRIIAYIGANTLLFAQQFASMGVIFDRVEV